MMTNIDIDKILSIKGPYSDDSYSSDTSRSFIRSECKILVIGAGGLGCEILTNLALIGFKYIHIIDMDTIDLSNLNRQFLFRHNDLGKSKAIVAAQFVMNRVKGVNITPFHDKIQDHDDDYYMQFNLIICGLDSIPARRWINATLVNLVDPDIPESFKPLIDGGTEGFKGQARVILPTISACYECSLDMHTPPTSFPICTIASTPRLPEHCIEWASVIEWPRVFKDKKIDTDSPTDIQWLYEKALKRSKEYNIEGVNWQSTQGVVKRIIPAIASTNAIVAAACCNEALKIATTIAPYLNNYMMYTGNVGIYTHTFELEKKPECPVCGGETIRVELDASWKLKEVIEWLLERADMQIKRPSISAGTKKLYLQAPPQLEKSTRQNLTKPLKELFDSGTEITVTDSSLPFNLTLKVDFK